MSTTIFSAVGASFFSAEIFWPYFSGIVLLVLGSAVMFRSEALRRRGIDKVVAFAPLFTAFPMGVFGADHFVAATSIAKIVPAWMPAHLFWVYFVGVALIAAALSIAVDRYADLAAALLGAMLFSFVLLIHIPNFAANLKDRFALAIVLRDLGFSAGAMALALAPRGDLQRGNVQKLVAVLRVIIGVITIIFGVEHFLHPQFVPVIPLRQPLPSWIPMQAPLAYLTGSILIVSGVSLIANRKARLVATLLGIVVFVVVMVVYLPLLVAKPFDELNYFADTLLFSGSTLALAAALPREEPAMRAVAASPA